MLDTDERHDVTLSLRTDDKALYRVATTVTGIVPDYMGTPSKTIHSFDLDLSTTDVVDRIGNGVLEVKVSATDPKGLKGEDEDSVALANPQISLSVEGGYFSYTAEVNILNVICELHDFYNPVPVTFKLDKRYSGGVVRVRRVKKGGTGDVTLFGGVPSNTLQEHPPYHEDAVFHIPPAATEDHTARVFLVGKSQNTGPDDVELEFTYEVAGKMANEPKRMKVTVCRQLCMFFAWGSHVNDFGKTRELYTKNILDWNGTLPTPSKGMIFKLGLNNRYSDDIKMGEHYIYFNDKRFGKYIIHVYNNHLITREEVTNIFKNKLSTLDCDIILHGHKTTKDSFAFTKDFSSAAIDGDVFGITFSRINKVSDVKSVNDFYNIDVKLSVSFYTGLGSTRNSFDKVVEFKDMINYDYNYPCQIDFKNNINSYRTLIMFICGPNIDEYDLYFNNSRCNINKYFRPCSKIPLGHHYILSNIPMIYLNEINPIDNINIKLKSILHNGQYPYLCE